VLKRVISFSLVLGAGVAVGWFFVQDFERGPAHAVGGVGGVTVSGNGDVNGDNGLDLSDAVYILTHLFQGGDPPMPCPGFPGAGAGAGASDAGGGAGAGGGDGLPDTGQTKCYHDVDPTMDPPAADLNCGIAPCPGQDASYENGCTLTGPERFRVNDAETPDISDDTVLDACTGLTWQRDTPDFNGVDVEGPRTHTTCRKLTDPNVETKCNNEHTLDRTEADTGDDITWCQALTYCESLELGNNGMGGLHDDWRLPNVRELLSIADYGVAVDIETPAIDTFDPETDEGAFVVGDVDRDFNNRSYWSSTFHERLVHLPPLVDMVPTPMPRAFAVNYSHGFATAENVDRWLFVRAVRGGAVGAGAGGGAVARGQGAGPPVAVSGNGDVNGDNGLDLSDAIYLLGFLFQGGPEPFECPPAGSSEVCDNNEDDDFDGATDCADADCALDPDCLPTPSLLPATGKAKCFHEDGTEDEECDDPEVTTGGPCPGQDAFYAANGIGCPDDASRFVLHDGGAPDMLNMPVDDTVEDNCTGLWWQQHQADVDGSGTISFDVDEELNWCEALTYCDDLDFGGFTDWRLPNIRELQSIVDYSRWHPDLPMDPKFEGIASWYWSSTSNTNAPALKYFVNFDIGEVRHTSEDKNRAVRAVRGP